MQYHLLPLLFASLLSTAHAEAPDPASLLANFVLHPDFELALVAAEPVIFDPVDIAFDEFGRPFVLEMPGYPFKEDGRVVMLGDAEGDGFFETRTVFAEGVGQADSLLPYRGGLLMAAPPALLFLQDTDGDGVADSRETLLRGFATGNPQHNYNGLTHGLDNWIYAANGGNGGVVHWPESRKEKVSLSQEDFRFDLRGMRIETVGRSTGGFEIALDAWGRYFATHNLYPMSHLVFPERYAGGAPLPKTGALHEIIDDPENGLTRIYPIGPQETRVNHPEQSGYFSGSCGLTYYGGGAFGEDAEGDLLVCDVVLNLIHRRKLEPDGSTFAARRDRPGVEFLASTDRSFRPVNMAVAPDGSLWIADMYRDVIEHPEWIPDEIEAGLDLNAGKEKGRIYRVTRKGAALHEPPRFSKDDLPYAVAALGHPNQWYRTTAQRLLVEWNDHAALAGLRDIQTNGNEFARLHAMWTLEGLDALDDDLALAALADPHPGVRENALLAAGHRAATNEAIRAAVLALASDEAPRVRLYAALAMGALDPDAEGALSAAVMSIARQDIADPWTRIALLPAISRAPAPVLAALFHGELSGLDDREPLAGLIGEMAGARMERNEMIAMLERIADASPAGSENLMAALADGLSQGLESRREHSGLVVVPEGARFFERRAGADSMRLATATWRLRAALGLSAPEWSGAELEQAAALAADETLAPETRAEALRLWAYADFELRRETLFGYLDTRHPAEVQLEAIRQLGENNGPAVAERLIEQWRALGPAVRVRASDMLLYAMPNHPLLMTALEERRISLGEMNLHLERRRTLLHSPSPGVKERAQALFSDAGIVTRKEALERMRPALALQGDAARGRAVFEERCMKCHQAGTIGAQLGPNLTEIYRKSAETILHDILDPNAAVDVKYVSYAIETTGFETYAGIIESETPEAVTLRDANNETRVIPREEIDSMTSSGLSLMPEELEAGLEPQGMADLLEFLRNPE
jgi:putative membrane-bound dehydrogenase-like protein